MSNSTESRRRYFRLEDEVILDWRSVTAEELVAGIQQMDRERHYGQGGDLYRLEQKIQSSITQLSNHDPATANCLKLLNERVDLLMQKIHFYQAMHEQEEREKRPQTVSLSATGIAFYAARAPEASQVEINFFLLPRYIHIRVFGTVVSCEPKDAAFYVAVNFDVILNEAQETLIQHLLHKQAKMIQAEKAELDQSIEQRIQQRK